MHFIYHGNRGWGRVREDGVAVSYERWVISQGDMVHRGSGHTLLMFANRTAPQAKTPYMDVRYDIKIRK